MGNISNFLQKKLNSLIAHPQIIFLVLIFWLQVKIAKSFFNNREAKSLHFLQKIFNYYNININDLTKKFVVCILLFFIQISIIFDLHYLVPDLVRFNNLKNYCNYTTVHLDKCGQSFFGEFFLKLSINFPSIILFDFFTNVIFCSICGIMIFNNIFIPYIQKYLGENSKKFNISNNNIKLTIDSKGREELCECLLFI
jgi:hypothetical protein